MRLGYALLFVDDVDAAVEFYERAFALVRDHVDSGTYGELRTGETTLALVGVAYARKHLGADPPPGGAIGLVGDEVGAAFAAAVGAGAKVVTEPYEAPWGTTARVADPDGNLVELSAR
jgi:lactoylglutathione lyase